MTFWETLKTPWQAAFSEGWEAYCAGSLPIGAVITREGEIIARGRNRISEVYGIEKYIAGNSLAHAEINALLQFKGDLDEQDVHLYTTLEPCPLCAGARMMHVQNVHYAATAQSSGAIDLLKTHSYMSRGVKVEHFQNRILENISLGLLLHSYLEFNFGLSAVVSHETTFPKATALAMAAFDSGIVRRWRNAQATTGHVLNELALMLEA
jgi:tRNA(adenine34) deaminase